MKRPETELAAPVVLWLQEQKWDVYQEVTAGGCTADIVAVLGRLAWIVEVKSSLSLALFDQALEWSRLRMAHYISVAVPAWRRGGPRRAAEVLARQEGIGVITIGERYGGPPGADQVSQWLPPRLCRRVGRMDIREWLCERQKTWAPAGSVAGRWTPFAETCRKLEAAVLKTPGLTLKETIEQIGGHHYCSDQCARSALSHWLGTRLLSRIEARREGRALRLYPVAVDGAAMKQQSGA